MNYCYSKKLNFIVDSYDNGVNTIQMTEEYNDLSEILSFILNIWNDKQEEYEAILLSDKRVIARLRAYAGTLLDVLDKTYAKDKIEELLKNE